MLDISYDNSRNAVEHYGMVRAVDLLYDHFSTYFVLYISTSSDVQCTSCFAFVCTYCVCCVCVCVCVCVMCVCCAGAGSDGCHSGGFLPPPPHSGPLIKQTLR